MHSVVHPARTTRMHEIHLVDVSMQGLYGGIMLPSHMCLLASDWFTLLMARAARNMWCVQVCSESVN